MRFPPPRTMLRSFLDADPRAKHAFVAYASPAFLRLHRTMPAPPGQSAAQRRRLAAGSKQSRVISMLRSPRGATIAAMMTATGWQQHSVRGFLAGVVRRKLSLNLQSEAGDGGRLYRIKDGKTRAQPSTQPAA